MTDKATKSEQTRPGVRARIGDFVEGNRFQKFIIGLILVNSVILGMETSAGLMQHIGGVLKAVDTACLVVFCIEIVLKLIALRWRFFCSGWNVFDFLVVGIALVPASGPLAVLRALRALRALRMISVVPSMRRVIGAFIHAIPGLTSVIAILLLFFYIASVLATSLFGESHPDWFGSLGASLYSLFQIMTLESWSMGIVRPVMEVHPWAWIFFVSFIVVTTFFVLNLFIGIVVNSMQEMQDEEIRRKEKEEAMARGGDASREAQIATVVHRMEDDLAHLKAVLADIKSK